MEISSEEEKGFLTIIKNWINGKAFEVTKKKHGSSMGDTHLGAEELSHIKAMGVSSATMKRLRPSVSDVAPWDEKIRYESMIVEFLKPEVWKEENRHGDSHFEAQMLVGVTSVEGEGSQGCGTIVKVFKAVMKKPGGAGYSITNPWFSPNPRVKKQIGSVKDRMKQFLG